MGGLRRNVLEAVLGASQHWMSPSGPLGDNRRLMSGKSAAASFAQM